MSRLEWVSLSDSTERAAVGRHAMYVSTRASKSTPPMWSVACDVLCEFYAEEYASAEEAKAAAEQRLLAYARHEARFWGEIADALEPRDPAASASPTLPLSGNE